MDLIHPMALLQDLHWVKELCPPSHASGHSVGTEYRSKKALMSTLGCSHVDVEMLTNERQGGGVHALQHAEGTHSLGQTWPRSNPRLQGAVQAGAKWRSPHSGRLHCWHSKRHPGPASALLQEPSQGSGLGRPPAQHTAGAEIPVSGAQCRVAVRAAS